MAAYGTIPGQSALPDSTRRDSADRSVSSSSPNSAITSGEWATSRGADTGVGWTFDQRAPCTWRGRRSVCGSPGVESTKREVNRGMEHGCRDGGSNARGCRPRRSPGCSARGEHEGQRDGRGHRLHVEDALADGGRADQARHDDAPEEEDLELEAHGVRGDEAPDEARRE